MNVHRIYKGYAGIFEFDDDADVIRGHVVNTKDTITFQGKTVAEAMTAFQESVDDYLAFCESLGEAPEKPFSGKMMIRLEPELHHDLSLAAQIMGVSLNTFVSNALGEVVKQAAHILGPEIETAFMVPRRPKPKNPKKAAGSTT